MTAETSSSFGELVRGAGVRFSKPANPKKRNAKGMPLTSKGKKIMKSMGKTYGPKKAKEVFYAMKAEGKLKGVEGRRKKAHNKGKVAYKSYG